MRIESTDAFNDWIDNLKDVAGRARIQARIERLASGNPGKFRMLTSGIFELKIDVGPGYRVYYVRRGSVLILLLAGGDKASQSKDIRKAHHLAKDF